MWYVVGWCECGSNSVGRVSASQAEGRGFESRLPLCYTKQRLSPDLAMRRAGLFRAEGHKCFRIASVGSISCSYALVNPFLLTPLAGPARSRLKGFDPSIRSEVWWRAATAKGKENKRCSTFSSFSSCGLRPILIGWTHYP